MRLLPLFSLLVLSGCSGPPPTDAYLIERFDHDASAFHKIQELLCRNNAKQIIMMDPEWSEPKITDAERNQFYSLFKKIGASGVYYDGDCSFRIAVWAVGLAGGGDYKGYSYKPSDYWLGDVTSKPLDEISKSRQNVIFASRELHDGWYLYFQHWP